MALPGGSWKRLSDELDRLTHHIGEARSKTWVFKRLNRSFQRCRDLLVSCYQRFEVLPLSHSANFDHRRRPEALRTAMATAFFCPTKTTSRLPLVTPV